MVTTKHNLASKRDESLLMDEPLTLSWQEYYGVLPNTEPVLARQHFGMLHTVPVPSLEMFTGTEKTYLLDVIEDSGKGKEKVVTFQRECTVKYDEDYIGYYCSLIFRSLGVLPESIPVEKLDDWKADADLKAVDKVWGSTLIKQRWDTVRQLTLRASVNSAFNETLQVDMREVERFLDANGIRGDKAEQIRKKAKSDPRAFAQLREMLQNSVLEQMNKLL